MTASGTALRLTVRGIVQGVGFRPTVARRARELGLAGSVQNTPRGVVIELGGARNTIEQFQRWLVEQSSLAPLIAKVEVVELEKPLVQQPDAQQRSSAPEATQNERFQIRATEATGVRQVWLTPDLAICDACLAELHDPTDRRYGYGLIGCAQCGPRYSILRDLPFDRGQTVMTDFPLCAACRAEYEDPEDRRYHAQIIACAECGPRLRFVGSGFSGTDTNLERADGALLRAARAIREGKILALRGLGGFQLICDATRSEAVARLRARKQRPHKPLAVMVSDLAAAKEVARIDEAEERVLTGPVRPILLLERDPGSERLCPEIAPDSPLVGLMLPTTGVHDLLLAEVDRPIVATSGNLSGEPICVSPEEALDRLAGLADVFLVHNRPILRPVDDPVVRVMDGQPVCLRLGRGQAPLTLPIPGAATVQPASESDGTLAMGGHLKTTVALEVGGHAVISQHIGDLDTVRSRQQHRQTREDLVRLYAAPPGMVVHDLHPDYATSAEAEELDNGTAVQHHVAHVYSCMLEHGLTPGVSSVLALTWDGTGYGANGELWGGEVLRIEPTGWKRVGSLYRFPLPGGEAAIVDPRRAALGARWESAGEDAFGEKVAAHLSGSERAMLAQMLRSDLHCPRTSAAGRLFDTAAALLGLVEEVSFEGQAAMQVEYAAMRWQAENPGATPEPLSWCITEHGDIRRYDWRPTLDALVAESGSAGEAWVAERAARFQATLVAAGVELLRLASQAEEQRAGAPLLPVVLTGGCFQNKWLSETMAAALRRRGHGVLLHQRIPPNDGGLAAGQLMAVQR